MKYFEIRDILRKYPDMTMYIIFGERSNGKTYSCLDYALEQYADHGAQTAYLRRSREDVKTGIVSELYASHIRNGRFEKFFKKAETQWNSVIVKNGMVYPRHYWYTDKGILKSKRADNPVLITAALSTWQHTKGISFPAVETVIFDEFLTTGLYLPDEVNTFQNVLSSFVRERGNVKVFLVGNTVSKYSPYFSELGLDHVGEMKPGDAQVYTSGDGKAKYLVMLTDGTGGKESDKYFSVFGNTTSQMITGGAWEMSAYPVIPDELNCVDGQHTFFIAFSGKMTRGKVVMYNGNVYILFTPARRDRVYDKEVRKKWYANTVIYTDYVSRDPHDFFCLTAHGDRLTKLIRKCINEGRVYFANNETGDTVSHYLKWCCTTKIVG